MVFECHLPLAGVAELVELVVAALALPTIAAPTPPPTSVAATSAAAGINFRFIRSPLLRCPDGHKNNLHTAPGLALAAT